MSPTIVRLPRLALVTVVLACGAGCASPASAPGGTTDEPWLAWRSPVLRAHPLVGRVYDVRASAWATPEALVARAAGARYVLIGEKHDNEDHHRLQAWLLQRMLDAGRRPGLAVEMLRSDRREAIDAFLAQASAGDPGAADAFARAVDWQDSGWPDFAIYRPVFVTALAAGLRIVPGDLSAATLSQVHAGGVEALGPGEVKALALDDALAPAQRASLAEAIREAHCGMAPHGSLDGMIAVQRARDASLADALLRADGGDGSVLIAGAGHVHDDAAPAFLRRRAPDASLLAVALVEVDASALDVNDYLEEYQDAGFDFVWLTPRVDELDPCEKFKEQLERMRR